VVSTRTVASYTFTTLQNVVQWTGPIQGTARETLLVIVPPSGDAALVGVDVCNCVAAGGGGAGTLRVGNHRP
jgi:hypothetical protein